MTNGQVLALVEGLPLVDAPNMNGEFNYAISENFEEAKRQAISINKAIEPDEKVKEFEDKSKKLMIEHANKDAVGEAISRGAIIGGRRVVQYDIPGLGDPDSKYNKAYDKLKAEYQEHIDAHDKKLKFLENGNKKFKPVMIEKSDIPDGLSRAAMDAVRPLIKKK